MLHDRLQKIGGCRLFFRYRTLKFLIGVFLKVHSTSAVNRTWSSFVPLCRRRFNRNTAIISRTRYFPYLYNKA